MQKFYYLTGAMVLVLGGLGVYSSQAGNKMITEPEGTVVIEEVVYTISPKQQKPVHTANTKNAINNKGGFMPLAGDKGVEVAPAPEEENQQPQLEQNPSDNVTIQEETIETAD